MRFLMILLTLLPWSSLAANLIPDPPLALIDNYGDIQKFLATTQALLPETFTSMLPDNLKIDFKSKSNESFAALCNGEKDVEVARLNLNRLTNTIHGVELNSSLLYAIGLGAEQPCHGKNAYRYAQAALIHELTHAFDLNSGHLSASQQFERAANWNNGSFKNKHPSRMDTYENSSVEEFFAVNMEHFILDADYACRRPELFEYYKKLLKYDPSPSRSCQTDRIVFLKDDMRSIRSINPEEISSVHYLMASKGDTKESQFGHAMIRMVFCKNAPDLKACEADPKKNLILSYRANADQLSTLGSIFGSYELLPLIFSQESIKNEYSITELRELTSYPLALAPDEMKALANRVTEQFWNYGDRYRVLSVNCATEAAYLFKSVLPFNHPFQSSRSITPEGILEDLQKYNMITGSPESWAKSAFALLDKSLHTLGSEDNIADYLAKHNANERRQNFPIIVNSTEQKKQVAALYFIEKRALQLEKKRIISQGQALNTIQPPTGVFLSNCLRGYGLPLVGEYSELLQKIQALLADEDAEFNKLWSEYSQRKSADPEYKQSEDNLRYLKALLKQMPSTP